MRNQKKRAQQIRDATMALGKERDRFVAADVFLLVHGFSAKPNGRGGNPTSGISRALSALIAEGQLVRAGEDRGRDAYALAPDEPQIVMAKPAQSQPLDPSAISAPTKEMLMQGKARPARARAPVYLEEPLWPEERAQ